MGNNWFYYRNTQAVALKLKNDLNKIRTITDIIIQIIFILYYTVSIIINHEKVGIIIFQSVFLAASLFYFVYHVLTLNEKNNKDSKMIRKTIRYAKYVLRPIYFIVVISYILATNGSDLQIMLTIISIVAYFIQILVNIIICFTKKYIELFTESLKMDYEKSDAVRAVINSRRYPIKKEGKVKLGDKIFAGVLVKADNFITENKDTNPEVELTNKQIKARAEIEKIKEEYIPEAKENEEMEIDSNVEVENITPTADDIKEEIVEEAKKKIFGFFGKKK